MERGRSGTSIERPELQRMQECTQDRLVDFMTMHKIDRLTHNQTDDSEITKKIPGASTYLVSATEAISMTPSGRLLHGIMAAIAELLPESRLRRDERDAAEDHPGRHTGCATHKKPPADGQELLNSDPCRDSGETYVATHHKVELRGFEPLTPCMPCKCATNCATAPLPQSGNEEEY